ncbi:MAG: outer membrane protein assembly factor BamD [Acidobacteriota bacterium]
MKRILVSIVFVVLSGLLFNSTVSAQRNIDRAIDRDPILEQDAKHNLNVAKQYFLLKKAYKAVLMRFEETFAAYPDFSRMDEFLYYAGMSSYYLSENKGKQKVNAKSDKEDKFAPAKLREDAVAYLSLLIEKKPESQYRDEAEKTLALLKNAATPLASH